jgi:hypothetical protein
MSATRRDLSWEGDEIGLKMKVGYVDLVSVGEREKIIIDVLDDDEGLTSFTDASRIGEGNLSMGSASGRRGEPRRYAM